LDMVKKTKWITIWITWWNNLICVRSYSHLAAPLTLEKYILLMVEYPFYCLLYGRRLVDKKSPDKCEIIGSVIATIGTAVIFYSPRH
jgi:hypothetical protein